MPSVPLGILARTVSHCYTSCNYVSSIACVGPCVLHRLAILERLLLLLENACGIR